MNIYILKKHREFFIQIGVLVAISLIFLFTKGWLGLASVLLGGASWIIPNIYSKLRMKKMTTIFNIQAMLKQFLTNQILKLALSFGMIILILSLLTVDKKGFLIGYIAMIFTSFPMLIPKTKTNKPANKPRVFEGRVIND